MNAIAPAAPPPKEADKPLKAIERQLLQLVVVEGMRQTEAMRHLRPMSKRPDVMAAKIMRAPHVLAAIRRMEEDALSSAGVTKSWIINELRKIGNANLFHADGRRKLFDELDPDTRAAIASIEVETIDTDAAQLRLFDGTPLVPNARKVERVTKYKLWDKKGALVELASIARLKAQEQVDMGRIGPGLTIVVQQATAVSPGTQGQPVSAQRVAINLPPPR
jgi:hypothetical protein